MPSSDPTVLLAALAAALSAVAAVAGVRAARGSGGGAIAAASGGGALLSLAAAVIALSTSAADTRALGNARHAATTDLLAQTASGRLALDVRLDEVTSGLRAELASRDRDRSRLDAAVADLDARVAAIAGDLGALQVAETRLRRMLAEVEGTEGLLITREGRWRSERGASSFEPCGWGEAWHVAFAPLDGARPRLVEMLRGRDEAQVAFTGVLSTAGAYGRDGGSRHLFLVVDGVPSERADCE